MWFRRSIAAVAGSAILAGLIAAIVEQKKLFDAEQKAEEETEEAEEPAAEAETESIELTPDHPDGESEE